MAEKSAPSPAQPSITIDAPASAYTPQQEGVTGEKQPQISGLTQEEYDFLFMSRLSNTNGHLEARMIPRT